MKDFFKRKKNQISNTNMTQKKHYDTEKSNIDTISATNTNFSIAISISYVYEVHIVHQNITTFTTSYGAETQECMHDRKRLFTIWNKLYIFTVHIFCGRNMTITIRIEIYPKCCQITPHMYRCRNFGIMY